MSEIERSLGIVPFGSNKQQRAVDALKRIATLAAPQSSASAIANTLTNAVREAVGGAVPYGRQVDIEMNVARKEADGSSTTAQIKLRCGGRND